MTKMWLLCLLLVSLVVPYAAEAYPPAAGESKPYIGFDRNDYPGDASLATLRRSFRYTSYWLNTPPGDARNTWTGKRPVLLQHDFGFVVLFNGRLDAQLKGQDAIVRGTADGKAAIAAAVKEGFPPHVLIFLDQEEGGRLLPEQLAYVFAWVDAVRGAGARAGVYCSGIEVPDGKASISTASDLLAHQKERAGAGHPGGRLTLWIANDKCPPSPGCTLTGKPLAAGFPATLQNGATDGIWQYAQSPRRPEFSAGCPKNNDADGNCYAPGLAHGPDTFVDLDVAGSPDPSGGR